MAAAGIYALDNVVPNIGKDRLNARKLGEAINQLKNPIFSVDLEDLQTNILRVQVEDPTGAITVDKFMERLIQISDKELKDGIFDSNGHGIAVKTIKKNSQVFKMNFYCNIDEESTNLTIKKFVYCINEF